MEEVPHSPPPVVTKVVKKVVTRELARVLFMGKFHLDETQLANAVRNGEVKTRVTETGVEVCQWCEMVTDTWVTETWAPGTMSGWVQ